VSIFTNIAERAGSAAQSLLQASSQLVAPSMRLGVTGLARSGKTVFTTALVHHLMEASPLPAFRAAAEGRIRRARLAHQPDDDVARFPYEEHVAALLTGRRWPPSTTRISELRVDIDYERAAGWRSGPATLALDIVDYPGEWLLDLALIDASYRDWSRQTLAASRRPGRVALAARWHASLQRLDPNGPDDEAVAAEASEQFKLYLAALRAGPEVVATTPPGRFLMPGDLAGSPALTFAPLDVPPSARIAPNTLASLMERRFDAYKRYVVRPFFREHFQRIDRQIVLVDVLAAIDAGPAALAELEDALDSVLMAFNAGRNTMLTRLFAPRADRVLFAATKADHVHHTSHVIGSTGCCACSSIAPCGALKGRVDASARWRWHRCGRRGRPACASAARRSRRWRARPRRASISVTRGSTARPRPRSFPASCRSARKRCSKARCRLGRCAFRASGRRKSRATRPGARRRCRISASTAPSNSFSAID
jgi:uncharacterized protein